MRHRKHRAFIRTAHGRNYALRNLREALADPAIQEHCQLRGGLFPALETTPPTENLMRTLIDGRHPATGRELKRITNTGTRLENGREVSNVCLGMDVPLTVSRSVAIAALVCGDLRVRRLAYDTISDELKGLAKLMDRRSPKRKDTNKVEPTGNTALFIVPEKADRNGNPYLHSHGIFCNVTAYQDGSRQRYSAGHFGRIALAAPNAQKLVDRRLFHRLVKFGYPVRMENGRCEMANIPLWLGSNFSVPDLSGPKVNWGALSVIDRRQERQRLDDDYTRSRKPKVYQTLAKRELQWQVDLGPSRFAAVTAQYIQSLVKVSGKPIKVPVSDFHSDADEADIFRPIPKSTLLGALPSEYHPTSKDREIPTCTDVISLSQNLAFQAMELGHSQASVTAGVIVVHGSLRLTPWLRTLWQLLEITYPQMQVVVHEMSLAQPEVALAGATHKLTCAVIESGLQFANQLQIMEITERRRLSQMLTLGAESLRSVSAQSSRLLAAENRQLFTPTGPSMEVMS